MKQIQVKRDTKKKEEEKLFGHVADSTVLVSVSDIMCLRRSRRRLQIWLRFHLHLLVTIFSASFAAEQTM